MSEENLDDQSDTTETQAVEALDDEISRTVAEDLADIQADEAPEEEAQDGKVYDRAPPAFIWAPKVHYDDKGRAIEQRVIEQGKKPDGFIEFIIHTKTKFLLPSRVNDQVTGESTVAKVEQDRNVEIPLPGIQTKNKDQVWKVLRGIFIDYEFIVDVWTMEQQEAIDRHVDEAAKAEKIREEAAARAAAAREAAGADKKIETARPIYDEKHVNKDGSDGPPKGTIITP